MTADLRVLLLAYVGAGWPVFPCNRSTKSAAAPALSVYTLAGNLGMGG